MTDYGSGAYGAGVYGGSSTADFESWLLEMRGLSVTPIVLLEIDFPSGTEYYAGTGARFPERAYKGRILNMSSIRRSVQQNLGLFEVSNVDINLADTDNVFISKVESGQVKGVHCRLKLGSQALDLVDFQVIYSGFIDDFSAQEFGFQVSIKDKLWTMPEKPVTGIVTTDEFPRALPADIGKPLPVCYGVHSDTDTTDARNRGAWPTLFLDTDSGSRKFILAAHAIKSIDNVYAWTPGRGSLELTLATHYLAFPAGWIGGKPYAYIELTDDGWNDVVTDASGNLGTVTVNCKGKEDAGDGTGNLIDNPIDVIEDFLHDYLGDPAINSDKFDDAANVAASRTYQAAGGYITEMARDEFLKGICDSFQVRIYPDNNGRVAVDIFEPLSPSASAATSIREQWEILKNTWQLDFRSDIQGAEDAQIVNYVDYKYSKHWAKEQLRGVGNFSDSDSIATYGKKLLTMELPWSKNLTAAQDVAIRLVQLYRNPVPHARFKMHLGGAAVDLTDVLAITHADAPPTDGYADEIFELIEHTFEGSTFSVDMRAKDVQAISEGGFFLDSEVDEARVQNGSVAVTNGSANINATGATSFITAGVQVGDIIRLKTPANEANRKNLKITAVVDLDTVQTAQTVWTNESGIAYDIIPSWLTADAHQKLYGHLCSETTGEFSNSDDGFVLL